MKVSTSRGVYLTLTVVGIVGMASLLLGMEPQQSQSPCAMVKMHCEWGMVIYPMMGVLINA